jgi:adenylate cyclase
MSRSRRRSWFKPTVAFAIASALTLGAWAGLSADVFFATQLRLSDALFPGVPADDRIVVVAIDDESIATKGRWPWPRSLHADLVDRISEAGAALIGYDVTFGSPSEPGEDEAFRVAVADAGTVVLAESATFEGHPGDVLKAAELFAPVPAFADAAEAVGHANTFPDTDGVVRALPPVIESPDGELVPSLSLALAQLATDQAGPLSVQPDGVRAGGLTIPTGDVHLLDVNFAPTEDFLTLSAADVLDGEIADGALRGKIVLIGATALGLGDLVPTPLDKADRQPGVLVHANALNTILVQGFLGPEAMGATLLWVFLIGLVVSLITLYLRPWIAVVLCAALTVGFFALVFRRFDGGVVMNMVYPTIAGAVAYVSALAVRYFTEVRERKYVTNVFGRYLAKDVVDEVLTAPEGAVATLEGASRPLSVLFADLRGFTAASEDAPPHEVVAALNEYLDAMTQAVADERGTIDKFMGDCVMAFWGAPRPDPEYVERAVRAAMKMQDLIDQAMEGGPAAGLKVKGCGVGVSVGEAVVGNIGSAERLDYTAIGDTVNTASRLCGVAGAGEIVVTEACAAVLPDGFRLAELPPLKVKGKANLLRVFQVLRPGQEAKAFDADATTDAEEEKGAFQAVAAPPKAAGYAPVEPSSSPSADAAEPVPAETRGDA